MVALYVTSSEKGNGKTAVGAGLGKHLLGRGKKIGFFKPVIAGNKNKPARGADGDAAFIKHLFSLEEPLENISPVFGDEGSLLDEIKEAYAKVSQGKDMVIVEGVAEQSQVSRSIAEALDAKVITIESYSKELLKATNSYQDFGRSLLGMILNKVPRNLMERVHEEASVQSDKVGVVLLGILPEDRALLALTVAELAEHIQGELLSGTERSAELVENFMLGAMCVDTGLNYFDRKPNKAVIVRSERPDMQLAALETSTRCLVLTGNITPKPAVLSRAKEKGIPIILTSGDISAITASIEGALGKTRFKQEKKLPRITEIMEQHIDLPSVYRGLGLAT